MLIFSAIRLGRGDYQLLANKMAKRTRDNFGVLRPCPVCGTMLSKGQKVRTRVVTVGGTPPKSGIVESMVQMFGCEFCDARQQDGSQLSKIIPGPGAGASPGAGPAARVPPKRVCPVCEKELGAADYLVARLFERQGRKPHLHVLGCSRCRDYKF